MTAGTADAGMDIPEFARRYADEASCLGCDTRCPTDTELQTLYHLWNQDTAGYDPSGSDREIDEMYRSFSAYVGHHTAAFRDGETGEIEYRARPVSMHGGRHHRGGRHHGGHHHGGRHFHAKALLSDEEEEEEGRGEAAQSLYPDPFGDYTGNPARPSAAAAAAASAAAGEEDVLDMAALRKMDRESAAARRPKKAVRQPDGALGLEDLREMAARESSRQSEDALGLEDLREMAARETTACEPRKGKVIPLGPELTIDDLREMASKEKSGVAGGSAVAAAAGDTLPVLTMESLLVMAPPVPEKEPSAAATGSRRPFEAMYKHWETNDNLARVVVAVVRKEPEVMRSLLLQTLEKMSEPFSNPADNEQVVQSLEKLMEPRSASVAIPGDKSEEAKQARECAEAFVRHQRTAVKQECRREGCKRRFKFVGEVMHPKDLDEACLTEMTSVLSMFRDRRALADQ